MEGVLQTARQLYAGLRRLPLPEFERGKAEQIFASTSKLIGIYGSRGVGKTTLMLQWLNKQPFAASEKLYISCDHAAFSGVDWFKLLEHFSQHGGKLVVLDEVQHLAGFEQLLKSAYDFLPLKIIFSGSSAIALTNANFTRRFAMFHLPQLSLREYIALETGITCAAISLEDIESSGLDATSNLLEQLGELQILPLFKSYLQHGGYPFYFEDKLSFGQKLNDTLNLVLQLELSPAFGIQPDKIDTLKKLLLVISRSKPLELSIDKLTNLAGISKPTLYKYLDYLQRGELIRQVPHEQKRFQNIRQPDKLYMYHPNLGVALSSQADIGSLRESFFAFQLAAAGHQVEFAKQGDFLIDEATLYEIGGRSKDFSQLKNVKQPAFLALDDIEMGTDKTLPLWLFGFLA